MGRFKYFGSPSGHSYFDLQGGTSVRTHPHLLKKTGIMGACRTFFRTSPKFFGPRSIDGDRLLNCFARKTDKLVGTRLSGN